MLNSNRRRGSVAVQVIGGTLLCIVAIGSLAVYTNTTAQSEVLFRQIRSHGTELARAVSRACAEPLLGRDYPVLDTHLESLVTGHGDVIVAQVVREDGTVVAAAVRLGRAQEDEVEFFVMPILIHAGDEDEDDDEEFDGELLEGGRDGGAPETVEFEDEGMRIGELRLGLSIEGALAEIHSNTQRMFAQTIGSFVFVALLLVWLLTTRIRRPIRVLMRHAARLGRGKLDTPIELETRDEFGLLGETMDKMREDLAERAREVEAAKSLADAASQAKTKFLENMSHEFRTPLAGIRAASEILCTYPNEELDVRIEFAQVIQEQSERLSRMVDNLLDLGKIEAGRWEWRMEDVQVADTLEEVVRAANVQTESNGVRVDFDLQAALPMTWADRDRLVQLWTNLVGNAVKFSDSGGVVEVRAFRRDNAICVEVRDHGPGIRPEDQETIFERFRQVSDDDRSDAIKGTGLGLAIAQRVADFHGAEISVESEFGAGSTFRVMLPVRLRADEATLEPATC